MSNEFELFPGKSLSNLFEDIYNNQYNKKKHITDIVNELRGMINQKTDMVVMGTILKDLIDTSVRNDDMLIKLATIAQRIYISQAKNDGSGNEILTKEEREQLLKEIDGFQAQLQVKEPEIKKAEDLIQKKK